MNSKPCSLNSNYIIFEDGRVYSITRPSSNNGTFKGRFLKPWLDARGYAKISLEPEHKTMSIHRLVAIAFIPNPNNLSQVNHLDGDKTNNNINNLEWCTNLENMRHSKEIGLRPSSGFARGERQGSAKLTEQNVIAIRTQYVSGHPINGLKPLAKLYGVGLSAIGDVINRKSWTHI